MAQAMAASMPRGLGAHRSEKWHDNIRSLPEMTKGMRAVVRVFAAALIAAGLAVVPAVSETDPRTHTGHQHHKIPGSRKHLKSVVLVRHARREESYLGKRLSGRAAVQEMKVLWPFGVALRRAASNRLMVH